MMIFKTEEELRAVIALRKGDEVIDMFLESYLQGLEYDKWKEGKDLEATEEIVVGQDDESNDIVETRLVNIYEPIDVAERMRQWKLDNYQILRKPLYPDVAEYIDAVVKGDIEAQEKYVAKCLQVKECYPK